MNELLQKHGCANVFTIPQGLKELMSDISREVLREQPPKIFNFITNYLSVLLITREHGILAVKILDELCDCRPSVSEHLLAIGMPREQAEAMAEVIKEEIENFESTEGKEKVKESQIIKKILSRNPLDEDITAKVCQVARNAYRDYWYRKKLLEQHMKTQSDQPWEIAAQHTLEIYRRTKPSYTELNRATQMIQAAYRGYHVRRNLLRHLKPKIKKTGPKVELPGPPLDIAESREIDLGPVIDLQVKDDDVQDMFDDEASEKLGLQYDPMKTITHVEDEEYLQKRVRLSTPFAQSRGGLVSSKSLTAQSSAGMSKHARVSEVAEPRISRVPAPEQSQIDGRPSRVTMEPSRQSRLPEMELSRQSRASRIPSEIAQSRMLSDSLEASMHKISFSEMPPEMIPVENAEDVEAQGTVEASVTKSHLSVTPHDDVVDENVTQEITEDIVTGEDHTEGDSILVSSVPSVPQTVDTDAEVEDAFDAGNTTEEEGD